MLHYINSGKNVLNALNTSPKIAYTKDLLKSVNHPSELDKENDPITKFIRDNSINHLIINAHGALIKDQETVILFKKGKNQEKTIDYRASDIMAANLNLKSASIYSCHIGNQVIF